MDNEKTIKELVTYIIGLFIWSGMFMWANHVSFCIPILEKLGIAGLTYWQYFLGIFVTKSCVAAITPRHLNED